MRKYLIAFFLSLFAAQIAVSEEPVADDATDATVATSAAPEAPKGEETKTLSGMSILGNEEAPKSLVIIPWKSSEIGTDLGLSDTLDDRAKPVDKEVFLRELSFYQIRADE